MLVSHTEAGPLSHPQNSLHRIGLSARAAVLLLMAVYALTGGAIALYATWSDYRETVAGVERSTADLARLLEDHVLQALHATDVLLLAVAQEVREDGLSAVTADRQRWMSITALVEASPHIESLLVLDPAGSLLMALNTAPPREPVLAGDKDFVAALAAGEQRFIGQVARDWWSGVYAFPVARRLVTTSGEYVGIAVATVSVPYFKRLYQGLNLGSEPGLGVYRLDGAILVREPLPEADVGRNMANNPVYTQHLPRARIGTYQGKSAYDGVVRIVSYRAIEGPQLLAWVAMSLTDALVPWQQRMIRNMMLATLGLIIAVGLSVLAIRALNRERRVRKELIRSNLSLQRANAELERFAEVAAHHLQEPLRVITSYAQLLEKRLDGHIQGDTADFLKFLIGGSNDMKRLLHDLQRYTALHQEDVTVRPVDLAAVAADVREALGPVIAAAGAEVDVQPLPTVPGNERLLKALLRQLLENAVTYRSPKRPLRVEIAAERRGGEWQVSVRDNGAGIEPRFRDRVFRIFERLHPRHLYPGTGIGLAICRKIVERHGGRIWCETDQPEGVTFAFTLPA